MKNLIQRKLRQRFHVTPKVGLQFEGVLLAEDPTYAQFGDVVAIPDDAAPQKCDGDLFIRHTNIAYVQTVVVRHEDE